MLKVMQRHSIFAVLFAFLFAITACCVIGCESNKKRVTPPPAKFNSSDRGMTERWLNGRKDAIDAEKNPSIRDDMIEALEAEIEQANGENVLWQFPVSKLGGGNLISYYVKVAWKEEGWVDHILNDSIASDSLTQYVGEEISEEYFRTLSVGDEVTISASIEIKFLNPLLARHLFTRNAFVIFYRDAKVVDNLRHKDNR